MSSPRSHQGISDSASIDPTIQDLAAAYPKAVQDEVARYLDGFQDLPKFSQEVAKMVLARLPEAVKGNTAQVTIAANDNRFAQAA